MKSIGRGVAVFGSVWHGAAVTVRRVALWKGLLRLGGRGWHVEDR